MAHLLVLLLFVCTATANFTFLRSNRDSKDLLLLEDAIGIKRNDKNTRYSEGKVYYNEPFRFRKVLSSSKSYPSPPSPFAPSPPSPPSYSQLYAEFVSPPTSPPAVSPPALSPPALSSPTMPVQSPPPVEVYHDHEFSGEDAKPSSASLIVVIIAAVIATLIAAFRCFKPWKTPPKKLPQISEMEISLQRKYSYADLCIATKRFSQEQLLGKGGYGNVYKGTMPSDKSMVAIKVMSAEGMHQFLAELSVIGRLKHKNLVNLKGWCHHQEKLILVYDYMPNRSLDQHLFSPEKMLCWSQRYEIVKGIAEGLLFLHCGWEQRIVHRDIKAANVLLDSKFTARLGDFGLSKLMEDNRTKQTMTRVGTMGYIAPELAYLGRANEKSDIYSFGILLLEIACGKPVFNTRYGIHDDEYSFLLDWIWQAHLKDDLFAVADPRLCSDYNQDEMRAILCLGLLCTQPDADLRPSMKKCCQILNFEGALPDLPHSRPTMVFREACRSQTGCG